MPAWLGHAASLPGYCPGRAQLRSMCVYPVGCEIPPGHSGHRYKRKTPVECEISRGPPLRLRWPCCACWRCWRGSCRPGWWRWTERSARSSTCRLHAWRRPGQRCLQQQRRRCTQLHVRAGTATASSAAVATASCAAVATASRMTQVSEAKATSAGWRLHPCQVSTHLGGPPCRCRQSRSRQHLFCACAAPASG